jgi:hypothetical protein
MEGWEGENDVLAAAGVNPLLLGCGVCGGAGYEAGNDQTVHVPAAAEAAEDSGRAVWSADAGIENVRISRAYTGRVERINVERVVRRRDLNSLVELPRCFKGSWRGGA